MKLVGGGYRYTRQATAGSTGSSKSMRRSLRRQAKDKKLTPEIRRALKTQVRSMLLAKNRTAS